MSEYCPVQKNHSLIKTIAVCQGRGYHVVELAADFSE